MARRVPDYVELFAAVGVYFMADALVSTILEVSGALDEPVSDIAGVVAGILTMFGYITLRNRGR
ncbi:MAG: hypothetical protein AAB955_01235 [Patescibacteria group bacterium]